VLWNYLKLKVIIPVSDQKILGFGGLAGLLFILLESTDRFPQSLPMMIIVFTVSGRQCEKQVHFNSILTEQFEHVQ
jgi:hypothetical protein